MAEVAQAPPDDLSTASVEDLHGFASTGVKSRYFAFRYGPVGLRIHGKHDACTRQTDAGTDRLCLQIEQRVNGTLAISS